MTSGIVVNIDGGDINDMLAAAILESSLGTHINEAVNKVVNEAGKTSYNSDSMINHAVKIFMRQEIEKLLEAEYSERIREAMRAEIEKALAPDGELIKRYITKLLYG